MKIDLKLQRRDGAAKKSVFGCGDVSLLHSNGLHDAAVPHCRIEMRFRLRRWLDPATKCFSSCSDAVLLQRNPFSIAAIDPCCNETRFSMQL